MVYYTSPDNIDSIIDKLTGTTLWVPILSDRDTHYLSNRLSSVYIYSVDSEDEIIVGFNSSDLESINPEHFFSKLPCGKHICYNAKYLSPYLFECVDADMMVWYNHNHPIKINQMDNQIFSFYHNKYPTVLNINDVIPIMKIVEYCRVIRNEFIQYNDDYNEGYFFYERVYRNALLHIEQYGICIDQNEFEKRFNRTTSSDIIYLDFNLFTKTGRPNSSSNGINFNSLNKSDGTRSFIVSRHVGGRLFEMDYESYHLRLIATLIEFELPDGNIHEYFARKYFGTKEITPELYQRSKDISWKQLYGNVDSKYRDIEFFQAITTYINILWDSYQNNGYFETPLSKRKFKAEWFSDMNKSKLFNYIVQSYETEINTLVLDKIIHYLYSKKTKIIMYTYDAIVIDFHPQDGSETLIGIRELMISFGFPVHVKAGINYDNMIDVAID